MNEIDKQRLLQSINHIDINVVKDLVKNKIFNVQQLDEAGLENHKLIQLNDLVKTEIDKEANIEIKNEIIQSINKNTSNIQKIQEALAKK